MEYVEPFLHQLLLDRAAHGITESPTNQELEKIVKLPWCIWNAIIAEAVPDNKIDFLALMDRLIGNTPAEIKSLLDYMKQRKRNEFRQYQYYLGEYEFYSDQNNQPRFKLESRLATTATQPDISILKT